MLQHDFNAQITETWTIQQIQQVHSLKTTVNRLEKDVTHQKQIESSKNIPPKYLPRTHLRVNDSHTSLQCFNQEYETIFFKHLSSAIATNSVSLEIKSIRLQQLIKNTKTTLYNNPTLYEKFTIGIGETIEKESLHSSTPAKNCDKNTRNSLKIKRQSPNNTPQNNKKTKCFLAISHSYHHTRT